jgi:putative Mg2+ transporter-C (MgtC) family protein
MWDVMASALAANPAATPWSQAILRLLAACLLGGAVGLERELHHKVAGLRTHMLVSVGACLFCILTFEILALAAQKGGSATRTDPIRLIEAVTAGIAFLAAGSIIRARGRVTGLTTGAELWVAGAVGLGCGIGQLKLAGFATALVLVVLVAIRWLERLGPKRDERDGGA